MIQFGPYSSSLLMPEPGSPRSPEMRPERRLPPSVRFVGDRIDDAWVKSELVGFMRDRAARILDVSQEAIDKAMDAWEADDTKPLQLPSALEEKRVLLRTQLDRRWKGKFSVGVVQPPSKWQEPSILKMPYVPKAKGELIPKPKAPEEEKKEIREPFSVSFRLKYELPRKETLEKLRAMGEALPHPSRLHLAFKDALAHWEEKTSGLYRSSASYTRTHLSREEMHDLQDRLRSIAPDIETHIIPWAASSLDEVTEQSALWEAEGVRTTITLKGFSADTQKEFDEVYAEFLKKEEKRVSRERKQDEGKTTLTAKDIARHWKMEAIKQKADHALWFIASYAAPLAIEPKKEEEDYDAYVERKEKMAHVLYKTYYEKASALASGEAVSIRLPPSKPSLERNEHIKEILKSLGWNGAHVVKVESVEPKKEHPVPSRRMVRREEEEGTKKTEQDPSDLLEEGPEFESTTRTLLKDKGTGNYGIRRAGWRDQGRGGNSKPERKQHRRGPSVRPADIEPTV